MPLWAVCIVVGLACPLAARAQDEAFEELSGSEADLDTDLDEPAPQAGPNTRSVVDPLPSTPLSERGGEFTPPVDALPPSDAAPPPEGSSLPKRETPPPARESASTTGAPLYLKDVVVAPHSITDITRAFEARRVGRSDDQVQLGPLEAALETTVRNLGVQGASGGVQVIDVANALTTEATAVFVRGRAELAYELLAMARWMAPDLARVPAEEARLRYEARDFAGAGDTLVTAGRALWREPASQVLVLMGLLSGGLFSVLLLLLV
ncbi:MAG: hypothetical protein ACO3JL_19870, partial [Myxococcota bacterium]